jgi:trimethylamine--corrinoid protein Co-methyltransferase
LDKKEIMVNNACPQLKLLTEDQIQQVHKYALQILFETGVRVDSPSVVEMLRKTGQVKIQERRVRFSTEIVEQAIQSAPSVIQMYDRCGNPIFRLGDDSLRFGVGVTALYYQEPASDDLVPFTRDHMRAMTQLGNSLPHYDVISTPGIVHDVPGKLSDLYGNLDMFANTTKTLVVLTSDENQLAPLLTLFERLHGDLGQKPFVMPYFNLVSPLVLNSGTLLKMKVSIERGIPFIFSNYSMAGASTPLTPAGILAQLLAELLAGLTISQVMKPGTPISIGMLPAYLDMKTMLNFYDPQSVLINIACAEMLAYYKLPHCGTSCSGMGWGMDLIAADLYWMNILTYSLTKGGLVPFIGDGLGSKSISPCTVVHTHEIIDQALRFAAGFQLDDTQAALDEIAKVGPGGNFLSSPTTLKHYKTGYYISPLYPRWNMEKWRKAGQPDTKRILREKTQSLMEVKSTPEDSVSLLRKGEEYIKSLSFGE